MMRSSARGLPCVCETNSVLDPFGGAEAKRLNRETLMSKPGRWPIWWLMSR